jgi:hypothetical protein
MLDALGVMLRPQRLAIVARTVPRGAAVVLGASGAAVAISVPATVLLAVILVPAAVLAAPALLLLTFIAALSAACQLVYGPEARPVSRARAREAVQRRILALSPLVLVIPSVAASGLLAVMAVAGVPWGSAALHPSVPEFLIIAAVIAAMVLALWGFILRRAWRAAGAMDLAVYCPHCHYEMGALPVRNCPECGGKLDEE